MISTILISHGPLADAMVKSIEAVFGTSVRLHTQALNDGESADAYLGRLQSQLSKLLQLGEVIVISDFPLGTPFNAAVLLSEQYTFEHLTGMSAPMLLAVLKYCAEGYAAGAVCERALRETLGQTMNVNELIKEMKE